MKRYLILLISVLLLLSLCACNENKENTAETVAEENIVSETVAQTFAQDMPEKTGDEIIGTWICDDISDDCYFIFDEKGDAYAKWGTCTVYGYYDYYADEDIYDIDVPNFLYNEYKVTVNGDKMKLESEDSRFSFEKATMPEIKINAPSDLVIDEKIVGDWQSQSSYECYRFNDDNTAVITDLMSESTVDCKYTCKDNVVALYYMSSETKEGCREISYSIKNDTLTLDELVYERVTG